MWSLNFNAHTVTSWAATVIVNIGPPTLTWKAWSHRCYGHQEIFVMEHPRGVSGSTQTTFLTSAAQMWIFGLNGLTKDCKKNSYPVSQVLLPNEILCWTYQQQKAFGFQSVADVSMRKYRSVGRYYVFHCCLRERGWVLCSMYKRQSDIVSGVEEVFKTPMLNFLQLPLANSYIWQNPVFPTERHLESKYHREKRDITHVAIYRGY